MTKDNKKSNHRDTPHFTYEEAWEHFDKIRAIRANNIPAARGEITRDYINKGYIIPNDPDNPTMLVRDELSKTGWVIPDLRTTPIRS